MLKWWDKIFLRSKPFVVPNIIGHNSWGWQWKCSQGCFRKNGDFCLLVDSTMRSSCSCLCWQSSCLEGWPCRCSRSSGYGWALRMGWWAAVMGVPHVTSNWTQILWQNCLLSLFKLPPDHIKLVRQVQLLIWSGVTLVNSLLHHSIMQCCISSTMLLVITYHGFQQHYVDVSFLIWGRCSTQPLVDSDCLNIYVGIIDMLVCWYQQIFCKHMSVAVPSQSSAFTKHSKACKTSRKVHLHRCRKHFKRNAISEAALKITFLIWYYYLLMTESAHHKPHIRHCDWSGQYCWIWWTYWSLLLSCMTLPYILTLSQTAQDNDYQAENIQSTFKQDDSLTLLLGRDCQSNKQLPK